MDNFIFDESLKDALPPEQVRFKSLRVEPWPDGRRVRVHVTLTPFKQRPNLEVSIATAAGEETASASIIETMTARLVFTLHLRRPDPDGRYTLNARLVYPELGPVDQASSPFEVRPPAGN